jgi:hypothetical protein
MNLTVTQQGVLIPKQWLKGIDEVEVCRENHLILIIPKNKQKFILQRDKPVKNHHINENTPPDTEYKAAMQSYLSRAAYLATDGTRTYPKRETLYDRDVMLR